MKSTKILTLAVILLITVNLVLIGVLWFKDADQRMPPGDDTFYQKMLTRDLELSEAQMAEFRNMIKAHFMLRRGHNEKIFQAKKRLHESIYDEGINSDSLLQVIGQLQDERERELYVHLKEIYSLCDSSQKEKFRDLMDRSTRHRGRMHGRKFQ